MVDPRALASGGRSDSENEAAFVAWLRDGGCVLDACVWPAAVACDLPGGPVPRGVVVARDVRSGDELLRIPGAAMLTPSRATALLAPLLTLTPDAAALCDMDEVLLALHIVAIAGVAAVPAAEELPAPWAAQRAWTPYVACLPPAADFVAMLPEWRPHELAWLDVGARAAAGDGVERMAREHAAVLGAIAAAAAGPADDAAAAAVAARMLRAGGVEDARVYAWAKYCVTSRAFYSGLDMDDLFMSDGTVDLLPVTLVPLADMINHRGLPAAVTAEAEWVRDDTSDAPGAGWYILRATQDLAAGAEVTLSYGDRDALDLLDNYGFVTAPGDNAATAAGIPLVALLPALAVSPAATAVATAWAACPWIATASALLTAAASPAVLAARCAAVQALGSPDVLELTQEEVPAADALQLLRILAADEDDICAAVRRPGPLAALPPGVLRGISPAAFERPLSRRNEVAALALAACLATHLATACGTPPPDTHARAAAAAAALDLTTCAAPPGLAAIADVAAAAVAAAAANIAAGTSGEDLPAAADGAAATRHHVAAMYRASHAHIATALATYVSNMARVAAARGT